MSAQLNTTMKAQDLGSIRNSLGLLTPDKKKVDAGRLRDVTGLTPTALSELAGVSRPQLYKEIPLRLKSKFIQRVLSVVFVTDLAFELFGGNAEETSSWLMTPNSLLFGDSPFEVCMRGEAEPLQKWLLERLGKEVIVQPQVQ